MFRKMINNGNYILCGGRVVDPSRNLDEICDIGISNGVICSPDSLNDAGKIDVTGLVVAPGLIDMHVHLRQPGQTAAETIATGTRAAAAGGFTSIVSMPNTNPPADSSDTIEYIRRHARTDGVIKVLPCGCMSKGLKGEEMAPVGSLKNSGVVALSDDGRCIQNHELMLHVVQYAKSFDLPILDHCEDEQLTCGGVMHQGEWSALLGMKGVMSASEEMMVARDIIFSRMADWKVHIQHISTLESIELVRNAKKRNLRVSAEVTPHHMALTDKKIKTFDTNFKMSPPLRSEEDRQAVLAALKDGTITVIATDHAPHTETAKLVEFDFAPCGIIGLETAVPVCFSELYHSGILSLSELIAKFTVGPAEVLNIEAGTLAEGKPADITIIDPEFEFTIDKETFLSKSSNSPFHGTKVKGKAVMTIVDGKIIYKDGKINE
jgi:dihydroorotase